MWRAVAQSIRNVLSPLLYTTQTYSRVESKLSIVIDKTRLIIAPKMRPKVNSATKRFLFDHVWGLPYHRRTEDAFTQQVIIPSL